MNTSLITTKRLPGDIEEILGLKEMSVEEQEDFLLSVGTLIIESAVTKFIVSILPDERLAFELWKTIISLKELWRPTHFLLRFCAKKQQLFKVKPNDSWVSQIKTFKIIDIKTSCVIL